MATWNVAENKTYKWTTVEGSYLKEVPRLYATSNLIKSNDVKAALEAWQNSLQTGGKQYYDKMHDLKGAESDDWVFPFFADEVRQTATSWGDSYVGSTNGTQSIFADQFGALKQIADKFATTKGQGEALMTGAPGALYEPPKFYNYAEIGESGISLTFSLINTTGSFNSNYKLVERLITINKMSRLSGMRAAPPAIWTVTLPGYRYIKWGSADIGVKLLGQRKYKDKIIVPEGYEVSINIKPLYTEPREFKSDYKK